MTKRKDVVYIKDMGDRDAKLHIDTQAASLGADDECLSRRASKALRRYQANQELRDQKIYSLGGEMFSSITHGFTALMGVAILVLCVIFAARTDQGALGIVAVSIFGATAFIGFTISTIYHALAVNSGKRVMRVLDHTSIYFIIAGTYTPFSLLVLGGWVGWTIFGVNWALCFLGATLTAIDRKKFKTFAFICYLTMGWVALAVVVPLVDAMGWGWSLWLLFAGGIAYTLGAVVYKFPGKWTHGIWHLFTLAGLTAQALSVIIYMHQIYTG